MGRDTMVEKQYIGRRATLGRVNRVVAVLLALICVMLVIIAIPWWQHIRERSQTIACEQAMKSAKDGLIIEYMGRFRETSVEDAMKTLDQVMVARPDICPSGGEVYLIRNDKGIYEPVCGLHDSDTKRRVRLNASRAKDLLEEGRRAILKEGGDEPDSVAVTLNGRQLECMRVMAKEKLRRGTGTTQGYKGTVCFYGLAGEGEFPVSKKAKAGEICYFIYADENHCAIWRADDGWTGDSYQ